MVELKKEVLVNLKAGADGPTGAFLNYFTKAFNLILDIGRRLGSAYRRSETGKVCPVE